MRARLSSKIEQGKARDFSDKTIERECIFVHDCILSREFSAENSDRRADDGINIHSVSRVPRYTRIPLARHSPKLASGKVVKERGKGRDTMEVAQ